MQHLLLRAGLLAWGIVAVTAGAAHAQRFVPVGTHVVDRGGGNATAIAIDASGFPQVVHTSPLPNDSLRYARWTGTTWNAFCLDSANGGSPSIAIDSIGRAHIAYNNPDWRPDLANGLLRYARVSADVVNAQAVLRPAEVAPEGHIDRDTSIQVGPGDLPHITFYHTRNADENVAIDNLWYARFDGTGWTFSLVKKRFTQPAWETDQVGKWNSLVLDGATPIIAYYDRVGNRDGETTPLSPAIDRGLAMATQNGSNWDKVILDDLSGSDADIGEFVSMVRASNGDKHLAYFNGQSGVLTYLGPSGVPDPVVTLPWANFDTLARTAADIAIGLGHDGLPIVAYVDLDQDVLDVDSDGDTTEPVEATARLRMAYLSGGNWQTQVIDNGPGVGLGLSMAMTASGHPIIAYHDKANGQLKVVFVQDMTNPVLPSFGTPSNWNDASATTGLCPLPGGGGGGGGGGGLITGDNNVARGFFSCGAVSIGRGGQGGPGDPPFSSVVADLAPLALLLVWMAWRVWRARRRGGGALAGAVPA